MLRKKELTHVASFLVGMILGAMLLFLALAASGCESIQFVPEIACEIMPNGEVVCRGGFSLREAGPGHYIVER